MTLGPLTREELSLLLYLETRAVDHGGLVNASHMNAADFTIAQRWHKGGFVYFGRVRSEDASRLSNGRAQQHTAWCQLSDAAFEAAHAERRARAERMWAKRSWKTTKETR